MSIWDGYSEGYDADARLTILRALKDDPGHTLNDNMLLETIKAFGFRRGRDYLHTQLAWLDTQAGAIRVSEAGSVVISELTQKGADHLSRDVTIVGIKPPSLPR